MTDMNSYQTFIAKSRYSRFLDEKNRREDWNETVARYFDYMQNHLLENYGYEMDREPLENAVLNLEVMPSMRAMMTAGPALSRDNVASFNCSALFVDDPKSFDEAMYILLCGTGVGFSVENKYIQKLPEIPDTLYDSQTTISVPDSKEGWAKSFRQLIALLYAGEIPKWDVSRVRPAGTRLKTFGGRASGPDPLVDLFRFVIAKFKGAAGRKLNSLECHDIMCKIGEIVVVGGVRRSALLGLSDLDDDRMRHAKSGNWWDPEPQRALANNSIAYGSKPDVGQFMREWVALYESKSGERGIFNREACKRQVAKNGRRKPNYDWLTNPCCFTGDMKLLTESGYKRFDELSGSGDVMVHNHNGKITNGSVWHVGKRETVVISLLGMDKIQCTPEHVFILSDDSECQAKDLEGKFLKGYDAIGFGDLTEVFVSSVESGDVVDVYDFTEPETNLGVVNGVVVHNSEIILRGSQFCNLTEVVVRANDTPDDIRRKIKIATTLGTFQSSLTKFPYLRKIWQRNTEEERLLGVSMTGILDNEWLGSVCDETASLLDEFRELAVQVNKDIAEKVGIPQSAAISCVKPSGCLPWDSVVTTDRGLLTMQELFEDHQDGETWSDYKGQAMVVQDHGAKSDISKTFNNGLSDIVKIKLNYGLTLRSSSEHKWFVKGIKTGRSYEEVNQFVPASEISEGYVIGMDIGNYKSKTHSRFQNISKFAIKMREDSSDIIQPEFMNPDIAWLLGYLWGDGCMSPGRYRIRFSDSIKENADKAARIIKEQFGLESGVDQCNEGRSFELRVGSTMLWHWLIRNGVFKYFADELDIIPRVIRESSQEDIIAFIAGMFDADGCIHTAIRSGMRMTFSTASNLFSTHFQFVSQSVGLNFGCSHNTRGQNLQKRKSMYLMALGKQSDHDALNMLFKHSIKVKLKNGPDVVWHSFSENNGKEAHLGMVKSVEFEKSKERTYDIEVPNGNYYHVGPVKSHNSVSSVVDSASGIHARHSSYYIRRVRNDVKDPMTQFMIDKGIPYEPCVMRPDSTAVFSFPMKAPNGARTRESLTAIEHLELWLQYQRHWCEHKPSITVSIKEHEWMEVGAWVYDHFDEMSGISFLPWDTGSYKQTPFEEITQQEYETMLAKMPDSIDWSQLIEEDDNVQGAQMLACSSGVCEI